MVQRREFNLYIPQTVGSSLEESFRSGTFWVNAFGRGKVQSVRAVEVIFGAFQVKVTHTFRRDQGAEVSVEVDAMFEKGNEGYDNISLTAWPGQVEHPRGDVGRYFRDVIGPIARLTGCEMAVLEEGLEMKHIVPAIRESRLPFRCEGYFLSPNFVGGFGRGRLEALGQAVRAVYQAELRDEGLPEDATPEIRAEHGLRIPRPFVEFVANGSALVYGLQDVGWSDYWSDIGL